MIIENVLKMYMYTRTENAYYIKSFSITFVIQKQVKLNPGGGWGGRWKINNILLKQM